MLKRAGELLGKKTPIAEIEAIANRKSMTALVQSANTRSDDESKSWLEASRLLRVRSEMSAKKSVKYGFIARKIRDWLGISSVESKRIEDLGFIAERFKYSGDVVGKYGGRWHSALLALQADQLDSIAANLEGRDAKDLIDAASSIRQFASHFVDTPAKVEDNNV